MVQVASRLDWTRTAAKYLQHFPAASQPRAQCRVQTMDLPAPAVHLGLICYIHLAACLRAVAARAWRQRTASSEVKCSGSERQMLTRQLKTSEGCAWAVRCEVYLSRCCMVRRIGLRHLHGAAGCCCAGWLRRPIF